MLSFFFFFANRNTSDFLVTLIPSERGIILRSLTFHETSIILHRVFYIALCVLKERQYFNQNNSVLAPNSLSISAILHSLRKFKVAPLHCYRSKGSIGKNNVD